MSARYGGEWVTRRVYSALAASGSVRRNASRADQSVEGVHAAQRGAPGEHFDLVFIAEDALTTLAAAGAFTCSTDASQALGGPVPPGGEQNVKN